MRTKASAPKSRKRAPAKLPSRDEPLADLISRRVSSFKRRDVRRTAERWLPIPLDREHGNKPFGFAWFGDPHLDDNDCNWPLLIDDIKEVKSTPGMYGAIVGDLRNNWVGRLVRIYMEQQATHAEGLRLAHWFLDALPWKLGVMGNHDMWNEGEAILGLINSTGFFMPHWEARVELRAGRHAWKVHVAHDFPGSSIYNRTHGPARAALFSGGAAELYVCGHRHNMAGQTFDHPETGVVSNVIRTRGYKWDDRHAVQNGFAQGSVGASVVTIFHPGARNAAGRISIYYDVALGCKVLKALRG